METLANTHRCGPQMLHNLKWCVRALYGADPFISNIITARSFLFLLTNVLLNSLKTGQPFLVLCAVST